MPYEHQGDGKPSGPLSNEPPGDLSASSAQTTFQSVLLQMIESAAKDRSQLRKFVFELARANLRREAWKRKPALTAVEVKECLLALETAISRVEADSARAESANISIPRLQINLTRPEPMPQLSDIRSAELENDATSLNDNKLDSIEPRVKDSVVVPLELRESFGSLPPGRAPREQLQAALGVARFQRPQVEIVYPEREDSRAVRMRQRAWLWFIACLSG